jgi:hypothetical protein
VELLKISESATRNIFGRYSSKRMKVIGIFKSLMSKIVWHCRIRQWACHCRSKATCYSIVLFHRVSGNEVGSNVIGDLE